jgi:hypothetical protein
MNFLWQESYECNYSPHVQEKGQILSLVDRRISYSKVNVQCHPFDPLSFFLFSSSYSPVRLFWSLGIETQHRGKILALKGIKQAMHLSCHGEQNFRKNSVSSSANLA